MRPAKEIPSNAVARNFSRGSLSGSKMSASSLSGNRSRRSLRRRGINPTAVLSCLGVLATIILTIINYIAIRRHDVRLSFQQLSMLERRVHTIGNHTLYVVQLPTTDEFLTQFSADDWKKMSVSRVDLVAFVYDDMESFISSLGSSSPSESSPISVILHAFETIHPRELSIILFPCGCIIPNFIFMHTDTRFNGYECQMLPGFVIPKEAVAFVNFSLPSGTCHSRDVVLSAPWYSNNVYKLKKAREEYRRLQQELRSR